MVSWKKSGGWPSAEPTAYSLETAQGLATLRKEGQRYVLRLGDRSATMPKAGTLDHAEGQLLAWGVKKDRADA